MTDSLRFSPGQHPKVSADRWRLECLSTDPLIDVAERWVARQQLGLHCPRLEQLAPSTTLSLIPATLPAPFLPTNPCIVRDGKGYIGIVRGINYDIDANGRYCVKDVDRIIRTRNFLARLDRELQIVDLAEIRDRSGLAINPGAWCEGVEDCRLFRWSDQWFCSATARHLVPDDRARMVLLKLEPTGEFVSGRVLHGYGDTLHQKNWMPVIDKRLRFVYGVGPLIIGEVDPDTGRFDVTDGFHPGAFIDHWRGGSPLLKRTPGCLAILHEVVVIDGRRRYLHRFVQFDDALRPVAATPCFYFREADIEFAAGLTDDGCGRLMVSFGSRDTSAWIACVKEQDVSALLRPLPFPHTTQP